LDTSESLLKPVLPALLKNGLDLSKVSGGGQDGDNSVANGCDYGREKVALKE
jgi:hypothetical protein